MTQNPPAPCQSLRIPPTTTTVTATTTTTVTATTTTTTTTTVTATTTTTVTATTTTTTIIINLSGPFAAGLFYRPKYLINAQFYDSKLTSNTNYVIIINFVPPRQILSIQSKNTFFQWAF